MGERRLLRLAIVVLVSAIVSAGVVPFFAHADARTDYLVRLLRTSEAFRVRAQAALSLGQVPPDPTVVEALTGALRDENAAVRAAAVSSLERIADPGALTALRGLEHDPAPEVRDAAGRAIRALERVARAGSGAGGATTGPSGGTTAASSAGGGSSTPSQPLYYVGVGQPGTKVAAVDPEVLRTIRGFIARRIQSMDGVVVAPEEETTRQAQQVILDRSLTGYYLDSSIVSLETRPDGAVRAQVSLVVQTYPGRDVRSMLSGAATVMGESGAAAQRAAIEGAFTSALRNVATAFSASARR